MSLDQDNEELQEIWFSRWASFGYKPINNQGWATLAIMIAVALPLGVCSILMDDPFSTVLGLAAILSAAIGHYFIFKHMA